MPLEISESLVIASESLKSSKEVNFWHLCQERISKKQEETAGFLGGYHRERAYHAASLDKQGPRSKVVAVRGSALWVLGTLGILGSLPSLGLTLWEVQADRNGGET